MTASGTHRPSGPFREGDRGRDGRVTAERHLGTGGEVAHPHVPVVTVDTGIDDEGRLRVRDLGGDRLHLGLGERRGVEHDPRGIAAAGLGGEGREAEDLGRSGVRHPSMLPLLARPRPEPPPSR